MEGSHVISKEDRRGHYIVSKALFKNWIQNGVKFYCSIIITKFIQNIIRINWNSHIKLILSFIDQLLSLHFHMQYCCWYTVHEAWVFCFFAKFFLWFYAFKKWILYRVHLLCTNRLEVSSPCQAKLQSIIGLMSLAMLQKLLGTFSIIALQESTQLSDAFKSHFKCKNSRFLNWVMPEDESQLTQKQARS